MSTDTRKTATASKDAHDDLFEYKRESESTSEFFIRIADVLERFESGELQAVPDNVLTTDHLSDIANTTATQTAGEVEKRLSRH
jgi:predicted CopG family antitoxin